MTCIVGVKHEGKVYIGGDSMGSNGHTYFQMSNSKVFRIFGSENELKAVIGYTSSFRMGQLLQFRLRVAAPLEGQDLYQFMCSVFIDAVIEVLDAGKFSRYEEGVFTVGTFIVGVQDRMFIIQSDCSVSECTADYTSVGSGMEFALGSLHSSRYDECRDPKFFQNTGERRATLAIAAAAAHCVSVGGKINILCT